MARNSERRQAIYKEDNKFSLGDIAVVDLNIKYSKIWDLDFKSSSWINTSYFMVVVGDMYVRNSFGYVHVYFVDSRGSGTHAYVFARDIVKL